MMLLRGRNNTRSSKLLVIEKELELLDIKASHSFRKFPPNKFDLFIIKSVREQGIYSFQETTVSDFSVISVVFLLM